MIINREIRSRRSVLLSGLALGAAAKTGLANVTACAESAAATPLKVRVMLDGQVYEFDEATGRDLGDYEGPGFVQRCVMVTLPDLPLSIFMRPDRGSERVEVVFELGRMWSGPPRHLGAYTVEIERGLNHLAKIEVPKHFWFSRWRWQSAPRPLIANVQKLIAAGLLPPYITTTASSPLPVTVGSRTAASLPAHHAQPENSGGKLPPASAMIGDLRRDADGDLTVMANPRSTAPNTPATRTAISAAQLGRPSREYVIMGLAGLQPGMPTTGDRDDIGPLTEPQARWVCTGASDAFDTMIAQAEASGTFPWNMRDEKTGAPFNFDQYPKAAWFPDKPSMCDPYIPQLKTNMTLDTAHHPALTYVPFLATGDPYYLEALQLSTTWCIGDVVAAYRLDNKCILSHGQTRAYAWCLRDIAQLAKVTPTSAPEWMLPRPYWERVLENNRVWFTETFIRNAEPHCRVFRVATSYVRTTQVPDKSLDNIPMIEPWMEEYLAVVLAWIVMMGHGSWREAFNWKVGSTIARTDGISGWQRAYATPYLIFFGLTPSGPWVESWNELWEVNVKLQHWHVGDPNRWSFSPNTGYLSYTRAVLALASHLGIANAKQCYAWADEEVRGTPSDNVYRWRIRPA